ncbi:MAG: hypothetical protein WBD37_02155, partial [Anderseniella sp.]
AGIKALYLRRLYILFPVVLTMPVYWLLISAGGWLALWQLITAPFHWNKTKHGISNLFANGQTLEEDRNRGSWSG